MNFRFLMKNATLGSWNMTSNRLEVGLVSHWKLEGTRIINGESKKRSSLSVRFVREDGYSYNFNQPGVPYFPTRFYVHVQRGFGMFSTQNFFF